MDQISVKSGAFYKMGTSFRLKDIFISFEKFYFFLSKVLHASPSFSYLAEHIICILATFSNKASNPEVEL